MIVTVLIVIVGVIPAVVVGSSLGWIIGGCPLREVIARWRYLLAEIRA